MSFSSTGGLRPTLLAWRLCLVVSQVSIRGIHSYTPKLPVGLEDDALQVDGLGGLVVQLLLQRLLVTVIGVQLVLFLFNNNMISRSAAVRSRLDNFIMLCGFCFILLQTCCVHCLLSDVPVVRGSARPARTAAA